MSLLRTILGLCIGLTCVWAQFPLVPEDVTVVKSRLNDGVYISYKEPGICEETPGVKSYSGYVHLPLGTLADLDEPQDYPINTFFWFFEARKDPQNAPLTIWLNGGPGTSSMVGVLLENGPCYVHPDSNSTVNNTWSWNNEVNMLYIDQPVQVGFSYDTLQNFTLDLLTGHLAEFDKDELIPEQNSTFLVGTFPSQNANHTACGTLNAARAIWHFTQTWFEGFPQYLPKDNRISIATESFGGRYGPAYASFFEEQNQKIQNGTWTGKNKQIIQIDTLMIINGCVDRETQWPFYPHIAYNNTYGIKTINESLYNSMMASYYDPGGCRDRVEKCRTLSLQFDPSQRGLNETVNYVCRNAELFCIDNVRDPYLMHSGRNYYDFATFNPDPNPPPWYIGYLNQPHVQRALGIPLNWTRSSPTASNAIRSIGDYPRPGWLEMLSSLLDSNVKVSLVYGDRDYACNWISGEAVSLAIDYTRAASFRAAGYQDITITNNDSNEHGTEEFPGLVRQAGTLSFARIFQAGHQVPYYKPAASWHIFMRTLHGRDVATGTIKINTAQDRDYTTVGPPDTWSVKNEVPTQPKGLCYVLDAKETCTGEQRKMMKRGKGRLSRWMLETVESTLAFPSMFGWSKFFVEGEGDV